MKQIILTAVLVLFTVTLCLADTIIVDCNGGGDYITIQEGINAAHNNDLVIVYPGTYYENIDYIGKEITVASEYVINNEESFIDLTIIDGVNNSGSVVSFNNEENNNSILCGFTIKNGYGTLTEIDGETRAAGGGIKIWYNSSPIISNCIITYNTAYRGGGIDCYGDSNPIISQCIIKDNESDGCGGAICCGTYSNMTIEDCNIYNNSALDYGGGIDIVNNCDPNITGCSLNNNSAENGGGAIGIIHYCEPNFTECIIDNNIASLQGSQGGGVYCNGYCYATFESCSITNNSASEGGGIHCDFYDAPIFIDCTIANNISTTVEPIQSGGGGISCFEDSHPEFYDCIINSNTASRYGGGVLCVSGSHPQFEGCVIDKNIALNGGAFSLMQSSVIITNSDICNNNASDNGGGFYCFFNSSISIGSSIIWANQPQQVLLYISTASFHYSDLQGGPDNIINNGGTVNWMTGNIDEDPLFIDKDNGDFTLYQESPCIDTGNELNYDPDGTRIDMGIYTAHSEAYGLKKSINWKSLPRLQPNNLNALDVLEPILDPDILEGVYHLGVRKIYYEYPEWKNNLPDGNFRSIDGYKIKMHQDAELSVSGYLEYPSTIIELYADQENWIDYFLPYSQTPEDAFANVWNNLTYIQADGWGMIRDGEEDWKGSRDDLSVDYGKSYIVGVERDCPFFTWNDSGNSIEEYTKTETSVFTYEEEFDYMMIFVDSTENLASVDEIGVFLNDECIGASVVEEFPVFIPAYVNEDSTFKKGSNEITFQVATYDKSLKQNVHIYVYNTLIKDFVEKPLKLNANNYAFVKLGKGTGITYPDEFIVYHNYPNPIRNRTTISFILPENNREAEVKIYNIKGQLVKDLGFSASDLGFEAVWDCTDSQNKPVSNGIYFCKITSGNQSELKKMLLLQ